ncbi:uncharacterized protein LOC143915248 [Arctopsyche grandis]|uniref:uncharacterized protein LOC143915248 n=1 Tax=Arctopsyche grandis TaxID=121162 RepID=UPI00406D6A9C
MPVEDELLSTRLGRLEIGVGGRAPSPGGPRDENPFRGGRRRPRSRASRPTRNTVTFKGKCTAIDRQTLTHIVAPPDPSDPNKPKSIKPRVHDAKVDLKLSSVHRDFHSLVSDCNRLKISDETVRNVNVKADHNPFCEDSWEKSRSAPSCSQQALNPPCDVTIDELASYFETFVHIPKKMTTMAEMMYT